MYKISKYVVSDAVIICSENKHYVFLLKFIISQALSSLRALYSFYLLQKPHALLQDFGVYWVIRVHFLPLTESRYPDTICDLRFIVFVVLSMSSLPFLSSDKLSSTFRSNDAIVSCNSVHWHYLQVCHTEVSIHFRVLFHIFLFYFWSLFPPLVLFLLPKSESWGRR